MRLAALQMIQALTNTVIVEETAAERVARAAATAQGAGQIESAKLHRAMARQHRIRALELRGRLAALNKHYEATYYANL